MDGLSAQLMRQLGMGGEEAGADVPVADTAETIYISSLALLKMLKHGSCTDALLRRCVGASPLPRVCNSPALLVLFFRLQVARACRWR